MKIGNAIKTIRKQLGVTQIDLSNQIGMTQASLSQIESGNKRPTDKNLKKICSALDIPVSVVYILGMDESDIPKNKQKIYSILFPSIRNLTLEIVGKENIKFLN